MTTTGDIIAGAGASVDRAGATAWTSPGNVTADDGAYTSAAVPTDYLVCSSFGFNIPDGATILGITVKVQAYETGTGSTNFVPQLISSTTPTLIGSAKSATTVSGGSSGTPNNYTVGGAADVWGASLTPAIVNNSGFGVALWTTDTVNTLFIDFVSIAVEYSLPVIDDGLDSWWAGAQQCFVGIALAATAALTADSLVSQAQHWQNEEIVPQPEVTTAGTPLARDPISVYLWPQVDEVPSAAPVITFDEGEWLLLTPRPVVAVPVVFTADDVLPIPPTALPIDIELLPPDVPKLQAANFIFWATDEEVVPEVSTSVGGGILREVVKVIHWYQGDDLIGSAPAPIVDDYWQFPQFKGAPLIITLWIDEGNEVIGQAPIVDDYWQLLLVQPSSLRFSPFWADDEVAVLTVSEDYWQSAPIQQIQPRFGPLWADDDYAHPALIEGEWLLLIQARVSLNTPQPWTDDDFATNFTLTEGEWLLLDPVKIPLVMPQPWGDADYVIVTTTLGLEESEWSPPIVNRSAPALILPWADSDLTVTAPSALSVDEGVWPLPISDLARPQGIFWATNDEIIPQISTSVGGGILHEPVKIIRWYQGDDYIGEAPPSNIVDEQYWFVPAQPSNDYTVILWLDEGNQVSRPLVDEAYWQQPRVVLPQPIVYVAMHQDEVQLLSVDEAYWQQPYIPPPAPIARVATHQDEAVTVAAPLPIDELYWQQPFIPPPPPVVWVAIHQDEVVTVSAPLPVDIDAHQPWSLIPSKPINITPWADSDYATPPVPVVDEDYHWQRPLVIGAQPLVIPPVAVEEDVVVFAPREEYWLQLFSIKVEPLVRVAVYQDEISSFVPGVIDTGERTYTVPAEDRTYLVPAEARTYSVPAQARLYVVVVQTRSTEV